MSPWAYHGISQLSYSFFILVPEGYGVCRGNPEGVGAALPTSPDRAMLGSHGRAEAKPQPQHMGTESDAVMQDVKQETKPPQPLKPQVRY